MTVCDVLPKCSTDGSTPLHHVCYNGSYEMLALLLSLGADGMTPVCDVVCLCVE